LLGLLLLTLLLGLAATGNGSPLTPRPHAVQAQTPQSPDDEQWVQNTNNSICDRYVKQDPDNDCDDYTQALRDCLQFVTANSSADNPTARQTCEGYVSDADAGFTLHPLTTFDAISVAAALDAAVAAEDARYRGLGLGDDLLNPFDAALRSCLARQMRLKAGYDAGTQYKPCSDTYAGFDDAAAAPLLQQLDTAMLAAGLGATDMLNFHNQFADCARDRISKGASDPQAVYSSCVTDLDITFKPTSPPAITSLGCLPNPVQAAAPLACTATVDKAADALQWSAPGGSPNAKTGQGLGDSFSTSYGNDGQKTIELTACIHVAETAQAPKHDECSVRDVSVSVTPVQPAIGAFGCLPATVAVGAVVNCHGDVTNSTGSTTRRWSSDGDPAQGFGTDYSVTFARAGVFPITFQGCNGSACDSRSVPILVQAAPTPAPTPAPRAAPTFTGTWDANNGVWTFNQTGTPSAPRSSSAAAWAPPPCSRAPSSTARSPTPCTSERAHAAITAP
jgi:hypothetical protein